MSKFNSTLVFAVAFLILLFFYSDVVLHPNDYLFSPNGDGIKNYYTYLFHAKYDTDFWNFGGMNYPYYEHMVYTDGHPLLSWLIGVFGLAGYGIGILNFLMLISFPVCSVFLFKILRHYGVKNWWAIAAAIAITYMSPQVYRLEGHFSLAYIFAIPCMWWLLIQSLNSKGVFWSFIICFYLLVFFFTHPYLGLILASFALSFWFVNTALNFNKWKRNFSIVCIQVFIPVLIFQTLVAFTDTHENRIGEPSGFFHYYASWKSVFVAHDGPLHYFTKYFDVAVGNWESWNYVGFSTVIFAFTVLIYVINKRKSLSFKSLIKSEIAMFMIAAHLVLMFAFCFPLKYHVFRDVVDMIGPLKQFRVLGRFGWIFFYVFTVFSVVGFYKVYLNKANKKLMTLIFISGIIFYGVEFYDVHKNVSAAIKSFKNTFDEVNLTAEMKEMSDYAKNSDYDAILVLPFQHMSSENILLPGSEFSNYSALILSYHSGKPLLNSNTARMSLTEAINVNNFFSPEFIEKEFVYDLPDSAKILIVKTKEPIDKNGQRLLQTSEKVFENASFKAFEFSADKWNNSNYFNEIKALEKTAVVKVEDGWYSTQDSVWFIYESFSNDTGENFSTPGALHSNKSDFAMIYTLDTRGLDSGRYNVSFWYYLLIDRPDVIAVAEVDSVDDGSAVWFDSFEVSQSTLIVDNWCFVSLEFEVTSVIEEMRLFLTGNGYGQPFYLDELLIRKLDSPPLFKRTSERGQEFIIYNNYWLRSDSFKTQF